jgi:hypothetical protein
MLGEGRDMSVKKLATYLVLLAVIAAPMAATGCGVITGSGEIATWDMDYVDFNRLQVGSAFNVVVVRDDAYLVRITIDKALYEYLNIGQLSNTLHIGLKPRYTYTGTTQQAVVHLPDLRRLELSGASRATVNGFVVTHSLDFDVSGASQMDLGPTITGNSGFKLSGASRATGHIEMDDGRFDVSGASTLELQGSGDDITINASGASNVTLSGFPVTTADIGLSGASHAVIDVSTRMDINLSGASRLEYSGSPKLGSLNVSGGSTISQRQAPE